MGNCRGSALIEGLLVTGLLVLLIQSGGRTLVTALCDVWVDYHTYETLMCLAEKDVHTAHSDPESCRRQFLRRLKLFGTLMRVQHLRFDSTNPPRIEVEVQVWNQKIKKHMQYRP